MKRKVDEDILLITLQAARFLIVLLFGPSLARLVARSIKEPRPEP